MTESPLAAVLDLLESAFDFLGIDYYLIGKQASEVWYGDIASRAVKNIDFAVLIGKKSDFEALKIYLQEVHGFQRTDTNEFTIIAPNGVQVVILPFGEIENSARVKGKSFGLTNMRMNGFKEIHRAGTKMIALETGNRFKVATLPAIILLKFLAYDDRPETKQKDARDIANIISHFFDLSAELIYDEHSDLFGEESASLDNISSTVIGREIRKIVIDNAALHRRIKAILKKHLSENENSGFVVQMVLETKRNVEEMRVWLRNMLAGVT